MCIPAIFDVLQRLADLGESREVVASEDIYNAQGALILKKGSRINQKMSDRIVKFKLLKVITQQEKSFRLIFFWLSDDFGKIFRS